ncbi:sugar dehydrogenase complex small subunit [Massilia sp.]|uniref:sugar dehydrogenase complex small subunit n=1 Tax=Massilia sp. TaxID=1882437 RepID=UPI00289BA89B|nr:sugar dehydrogenase complex small subunit [Massilia sp.]
MKHPSSISRRRALQALGALALSGAAGRLLSATRTRQARYGAGPGLDDFAAVSRTLTGKTTLDPALMLALYRAMQTSTPNLDGGLASLRAALAARPDDEQLLDGLPPHQQALSRAMLQGWYLGVAGSGKGALCVAFVDTLANRAVAAELVPPSYSYGPCGSWHARPESTTQDTNHL